jgi:hypothetical protein
MKKNLLISLLGFIFLLVVYLLSSTGTTPFDYFSRLADSFRHGLLWIDNPPPWLTELIPAGENHFYIVYPPMPAILLVPIQEIWNKFEQQYLAHILGAFIAVITAKTASLLTNKKSIIIWTFLLTGLGNIIWFMSATGSVWYLGQITSAFFMTCAIYETLSRRRPFQIGILLGAMYLSRINTIIAIPFFLYSIFDKKWFSNFFQLGLGIAPFILFNFFYNYYRFGTIFDTAYFLLPKLLNEENMPWFINGVANISYIPNNIRAIFWTFPKILNEVPYIQPSWAGLAIWITTPAFIYSFFASLKEVANRFLWISILFVFLIVASHGGTGWSQFGYRFAVDFYPLLFLLVIKGIIKTNGPKWHHWLLLLISILVNVWGVVWINFFGWVSF